MDHFGEVFTTSGLVLNENIKWITFHGSYDFAYFIKALSNQALPDDENIFNEMLGIYFCNFYDVRQMIKNVTWLKGSLSRISSDLDIKRIGNTHQAGSDSLVTSKVFFKLLANFNDHIDVFSDKNKLFGFSYKAMEDYDWNMGGFVNNFSNFSVPPFMMGGMNNMNNMNNINNLNNMNNLTIQSKAIPLTNMNKPVSVPVSNTPMYYQNGYNYQNNGVGGNININSMNSHNLVPNMLNGYYGNGNINSMNSLNGMNTINAPMNGFNPIYQQQMDYAYYGNFYPGGNSSNGTGSGSGSFKNGQNGIQGKENKFIQN
jgi:CCR4-NOT transcription complex subunit 7/8